MFITSLLYISSIVSERRDRKKATSGQSLTSFEVGFYPHPYASTNLQVQRVSAACAQSQPTHSAPPVVVCSFYILILEKYR